jgi:hypothetical protein
LPLEGQTFDGLMEPGLPELVHEPPIGATISTCLVGLRRSLARIKGLLVSFDSEIR